MNSSTQAYLQSNCRNCLHVQKIGWCPAHTLIFRSSAIARAYARMTGITLLKAPGGLQA